MANEEQHPYTSYNKQDEVPTLVGNWVEERNLKEMTGVTRNLGASQALVDASSPTLTRARGDVLQATHPRVMEHTIAQTHPADWQSTIKASYRSPAETRPSGTVVAGPGAMGPRERMRREALMAEARDLPPEVQATLTGHPVPAATESVYGADFKGHDLTGVEVGARVMKDPDGRPAQRDPTFLAETQMMERHFVDRAMGDTARKAGATDTAVLANPDTPVTIYTEAVAKRTYGGVFPGTATLNGAAPFGKTTNFTKPMSDYSKVVIDE